MIAPYEVDMGIVESKFRQLRSPVRLVFFTRESHCVHCRQAERLYERLASVTQKIAFRSYNFAIDEEKDAEYGVFAVPAVALIGKQDYGIRYYCCPQGVELYNFLDDIVLVSTGAHRLSETILRTLEEIVDPVQLKVFISPGCPYSLPVARLAMKLAVASDSIAVDIIDAGMFTDLVGRYKLKGIPMTIVNDKYGFYGALDMVEYVEQVVALQQEEEIDRILRYI